MAYQNHNTLINRQASAQTKQQSAMGIGVTTLVTIVVVLLLTAFAVLSLISANSNYRLSQMAIENTQSYYAADCDATLWYAQLDAYVAGLEGEPSSFAAQLRNAGYELIETEAGELMVTRGFTVSDYRTLMVTIAINDDNTTTIRQWQS